MAALSCYQPCRSHLAQPARCLDEDDHRLSNGSLSYRRRQFIERCHQARDIRYRDPIPADVSVKKTREELAKNAAQNTLTRRHNIESGWSKVEEVRKKFEGATTVTSFSRSFESPPRRRLADSLFASFKLPRRKEAMTQPRSLIQHQQQPKRKSAVELLAESKAFYVKSETVLDRKQELPLRVSSGLSQAIAAGGCHVIRSGTLNNDVYCNPYATTRGLGTGRRAVSAGEGLQNTLRRLLEHSDSRENVYSPPVYAVPHKLLSETRRMKDTYDSPGNRSQHNSGTLSGTSSSGTSGSKPHIKSDPEYSRDYKRPLSFGDARVFFPDSFVVPRQRPNELLLKSSYSIPSPQSSVERAEAADVGAISPPAQYAHSTQSRYTRSNSQCQGEVREECCNNINSHKSLPDLHTHTRCYTEHANVHISGTETVGRSPRRRRHSAHQRTASCSSKGTRSNHSSLISSYEAFSEHPSPGDDNYQYNSSSLARDSGGSSGPYTQPLARTDSASSTHHTHRYGSWWSGSESAAAPAGPVSAPPQFQDGAPEPLVGPPSQAPPLAPPLAPRVGIHFQASAPPPAFQDEPRRSQHTQRTYYRYHETKTEIITKQPQYQEVRKSRCRMDDTQEYINTSQICITPGEEVTSPLGTFKRQRCLRYKQRRPRPILRSKSDISDRYRRSDCRDDTSSPSRVSPEAAEAAEVSSRLHRFFDTLGLEERVYHSIVSEPALDPVFFSDSSTVDSNQLAADYTVHGPPQKQIYRNTEPPSVVERNARIIKWLCNCRKTLQQSQ